MKGSSGSASLPVSLEDVHRAAERIVGYVHRTPVMTSEYLDSICKRRLLFKCEVLQKTGSFKARGLMNGVLEAKDGGKQCVVTHSSGNAGQALAWSAKQVGLEAVIVVPKSAPAIKKAAIEGYGASIVVAETDAMREPLAEQVVREKGASLLHPSNDIAVISGQGTVGLELVHQAREHFGGQDLEAVIVPIGGGGLIGGVAVAVKALLPNCKVFAAEPANAGDAFRSKAEGKIVGHDAPPLTIADGLKTILGSNTFPLVRDLVDEVFLVEEAAIASATRAIWERMKLAIEPSAGVGVAVAVSEEFQRKHPKLQRVGVVLCGGNVDLASFAGIVAKSAPVAAHAAPRDAEQGSVGSAKRLRT